MRQSQLMSLVEAVANVVVGYALAVWVQVLVFPLFGLEHFGVRLNREGFPRTVCRDSNCMLEREASVHGSIPFR